MLSIREVSKTYSNGVQALRQVTLEVPIGIVMIKCYLPES